MPCAEAYGCHVADAPVSAEQVMNFDVLRVGGLRAA
jgi:hypothetical protein